MKFKYVIEKSDVLSYLDKHSLTKQYIKAKENILSWNNSKVFFKERQPKWSWIWYFRINRKYRALWYIENNELRIYQIYNHQ